MGERRERGGEGVTYGGKLHDKYHGPPTLAYGNLSYRIEALTGAQGGGLHAAPQKTVHYTEIYRNMPGEMVKCQR